VGENEYITAAFNLRWGAMRFLRVQADVFPDHQAMFDRIEDDYKNVVVDLSPATGNGVAVDTNLDTGVIWFQAPPGMFTADTHDGYLYSVAEVEDAGFTGSIHLGFPALLRDCVGSGVWSVSGVRMDRLLTLSYSSGAYNTITKAQQGVKFRIDCLRKTA
jgi:hypothetical protein